MLRGLPQNLGVQGLFPALPAQLRPGEGNGSWLVVTFLLGRQKLPQLQREQAEPEVPSSLLGGKRAACPSEAAALCVLRSVKLIKTRVVGQGQVCVPSERWVSSLSKNTGCRKANLQPRFTSISLSGSGFKGSPAAITSAEHPSKF